MSGRWEWLEMRSSVVWIGALLVAILAVLISREKASADEDEVKEDDVVDLDLLVAGVTRQNSSKKTVPLEPSPSSSNTVEYQTITSTEWSMTPRSMPPESHPTTALNHTHTISETQSRCMFERP
ncbi:hypothetical protein H4Q26_000480 [Puccinia striiformis f. sp. tritici PST-130]|nr:hypothetical protein H4Q26_000480 [Puccinia striiformis f. sp. tritici PST-130]